jgi:hypothetical protein
LAGTATIVLTVFDSQCPRVKLSNCDRNIYLSFFSFIGL